MLREKAKLGFFPFWAVTCAVWTGAWLLVDSLLVPELLRVSALRLVAIGLATAVLPIAVLLVGRALVFAAARTIGFAASLWPAASRGRAGMQAGDASPRRGSGLGDGYGSSAGSL